jgi:hypothetical protein
MKQYAVNEEALLKLSAFLSELPYKYRFQIDQIAEAFAKSQPIVAQKQEEQKAHESTG